MDAREFRVSDAEREHVGQLLQRAVGHGMLSLGEFTERMDTALAAKTRGELNAVLLDLPGLQYTSDRAEQAERAATPTDSSAVGNPRYGAPQPPVSSASGDLIRGRMSTVTRKGPWHVAPRLYLNSRLSSVTLDFTEAIMRTQVVEIVVDDFCSSVTLVVPGEATVDLNGLDLIGASATNKVRTGPPIGPLHVLVRGRVRFGSVTAKHPFGTALRGMMGGWGKAGR
ncbi:DUF1707 domain-containing protein [Aldersonia sp. NBC_00410]|jgi:hypothetical protein|uniref:DUF1707 SHOCT-like domain-containing protein n=1 Tax=Aldersonia sp. NBC_00410 TaxID=2975954 RepID=UPI00224D60D3|nr:DUF1707 domain-containing protein [Aldersonia sp. NBC_00410]MCX5043025.1 DUF1707 domain-containing protein [Aldersonia sp. NBC_00410]